MQLVLVSLQLADNFMDYSFMEIATDLPNPHGKGTPEYRPAALPLYYLCAATAPARPARRFF
jgi:hypothetical protein